MHGHGRLVAPSLHASKKHAKKIDLWITRHTHLDKDEQWMEDERADTRKSGKDENGPPSPLL